eukprot:TRINITY_DN14347_c0_g1_i1.p1 TRINITY_DN14347_c0_g1~~TRINITY_DN14347_c0_g1_i1.p1  ORF type:complete len:204 (+),score=29.81 TRINITY_DN14347_c0_g1_i1:100-711(+)
MDLSLVLIRSQSESRLQNQSKTTQLWSPMPIRRPAFDPRQLGISDFTELREVSNNDVTDIPRKSKSANIFSDSHKLLHELLLNESPEEEDDDDEDYLAAKPAPIRASNPHIQDNKFIEVNNFYDRMRTNSDCASTDSDESTTPQHTNKGEVREAINTCFAKSIQNTHIYKHTPNQRASGQVGSRAGRCFFQKAYRLVQFYCCG